MRQSISFYFILVCLFFLSQSTYASIEWCKDPYCDSTPSTFARIAASNAGRNQAYSLASLNLKSQLQRTAQSFENKTSNANARLASSTPVTITLEDMQKISKSRNSWVLLQDETVSFSMDIGTANSTTPQNWSLPTNFFDNYQFAYLEDFVPIQEVPEELRFTGANKVSKQYYLDNADNIIEIYTHYTIGNTQVDYIGSSYYYYLDGDEESFDATDYKFTDVPVSLGQGYSFTEESSHFDTGLFLTKYTHTKSVDAFGTLSTPSGDYECLRYTFSTDKYTRPDTLSAFTFDKSYNSVGFVTKEGFLIVAEVAGTSGVQTLTKIETKLVLPTALFDDNAVIQLNNDGKGISINDNGTVAHASAVLEVESDSLGVLIPRILEANRPANATEGLLIYQTDNSPGFYYYDGAGWQRLDNTSGGASARVAVQPSQSSIVRKNAGISQLKSGKSFISFGNKMPLDPEKYIVNIQAEGENNGLYISKKTANGFEVKEQGRGRSNIKFSYTIIEL